MNISINSSPPTPLDAAAFGRVTADLDLRNVAQSIVSRALDDLRGRYGDRRNDEQSLRSRASQNLADFGVQMLPFVLGQLNTPTAAEMTALSDQFIKERLEAKAQGREIPTYLERLSIGRLEFRNLREYLILLGPGIDAALPFITSEMGSIQGARVDSGMRATFASWARAYAFASPEQGRDILPTLREIREYGTRIPHSHFPQSDWLQYMDKLIHEIKSGKVTNDCSWLSHIC